MLNYAPGGGPVWVRRWNLLKTKHLFINKPTKGYVVVGRSNHCVYVLRSRPQWPLFGDRYLPHIRICCYYYYYDGVTLLCFHLATR